MARGRKSNATKAKIAASKSKTSVPGSKKAVEDMKYEIANEFGVNLGASATSAENGRVGGEITKRLVEMGMNKSKNSISKNNSSSSK